MNLIELFRHQIDFQELPAGQVLFREGDRASFMYVLLSGTAEIIVHDKVVETPGPGDIVGEMAVIDNSPRSATVIAKTDCRLFPIERERFNFLVQKKPEFALHVMRVLAYRLRQTDAKL
jgi:CRP-like cAMP-binding protein